MSEISKHRKTNAYFLTLSAGLFATTYDGVKLAEGLRDAIEYWCDKYHYSAEAVIFICDRKPDGKVKTKSYDKVDPHLHIVALANPGATVCSSIKSYLTDTVGVENCVNVQKIYDMSGLKYYLDQYACVRSIANDPNDLPEFATAHEKRSDVRMIVEDIEAFLIEGETRIKHVNKEIECSDFWSYVSKKDALTTDKICTSWYSLSTI